MVTSSKVVPLRAAAPSGAPWYTQFWPWFLIAVPAAGVVASFVTLYIAVRNADSVVRPDYYAAGVNINEEIELDRAAVAKGITAAVRIETAAEPAIVVDVTGDVGAAADTLLLTLAHPTHPDRDRSFHLTRVAGGEYRAPLDGLLRGHWYAKLTPPADDWRLASRLDFTSTGPLPFGETR